MVVVVVNKYILMEVLNTLDVICMCIGIISMLHSLDLGSQAIAIVLLF